MRAIDDEPRGLDTRAQKETEMENLTQGEKDAAERELDELFEEAPEKPRTAPKKKTASASPKASPKPAPKKKAATPAKKPAAAPKKPEPSPAELSRRTRLAALELLERDMRSTSGSFAVQQFLACTLSAAGATYYDSGISASVRAPDADYDLSDEETIEAAHLLRALRVVEARRARLRNAVWDRVSRERKAEKGGAR